MGRKAVDASQLFLDGLRIPVEDRVGEEGKGFDCMLHGLNPERILIGAEADAAKCLAAEAGYHACENAIFTHGGMGYAKAYHVERYLRESWIPRLAPVSPQLILCFIAEKVLGLPKSY